MCFHPSTVDTKPIRQRYLDPVIPEEEKRMLTEIEKWELEAPLRYSYLSEDERETVEAVLYGRQPLEDLPSLRARVVRIFISSTFTGKYTNRASV